MFCTNCGNTIYKEDNFCRVCRFNIAPAHNQPPGRSNTGGSHGDTYILPPRIDLPEAYDVPGTYDMPPRRSRPARHPNPGAYSHPPGNTGPMPAPEPYTAPPPRNSAPPSHHPPQPRPGTPSAYAPPQPRRPDTPAAYSPSQPRNSAPSSYPPPQPRPGAYVASPPPPRSSAPAPYSHPSARPLQPSNRHHHSNHKHDIEDDRQPPPPPPKSGGSRRAGIIAACIALFALGVSVGGIFMLRGGASGQSPNDYSGAGEVTASPTPEPDTTPDPSSEPPYESESTPADYYYQEPPPPDYAYAYEPYPGRSTRFPFPGTLHRYGAHNEPDIFFLQNTLNNVRRYYTSIRLIETVGTGFCGVTFGAVADFQLRTGLPITGIVDEHTWYRLMEAFENPPEASDPPFEPPVNMAYVTLVYLHLRSAPSTASESLDIKSQGTSVMVVSYIAHDSWFFVSTYEGYTGYMKAEFLIREDVMP